MNNADMRQWKQSPTGSDCLTAGQFEGAVGDLPLSERSPARWLRTLKGTIVEAWAACGAFEWLALGYLAVTSALILVFAENLACPFRLVAVNAFLASIILALCVVQARVAFRQRLYGPSFSSRWWHFWRHWYPHLFFLFCFEELAYLMTLYIPHWQDAKLIAFDYWLTGVHPSVWLEQFATPFRNDFMQLVYFTYFAYLLIVGLVLYLRRDWHGYWSAMTYSMVGYAIGYYIAMFFPIESPWFAMVGWWHGPLNGGPFTALMAFLEHYGRVRGAAFPSAHVTGATAALWAAWKFRRWLFWSLLPFYLGMCFSVIWGRYHYCADVIGGIITGTLGYLIGAWIMQRRGAITTDPGAESA
jgi:membrane-associated phospholipid phosphatase